jgi:hypothetical protein
MSKVSGCGGEQQMLGVSGGGLPDHAAIVDPLCVFLGSVACVLVMLFMVPPTPFIVQGGLVNKG